MWTNERTRKELTGENGKGEATSKVFGGCYLGATWHEQYTTRRILAEHRLGSASENRYMLSVGTEKQMRCVLTNVTESLRVGCCYLRSPQDQPWL